MDHFFCKNINPTLSDYEFAIGQPSIYWTPGQEITIYFLDGTPFQKEYFKGVFAKHFSFLNLKFRFVDSKNADVRVSFNPHDGSWSTVGIDARDVPNSEPTMNIGWEGEAVIIHEGGHMIGAHHEHMSPSRKIIFNVPKVVGDLQGPPNYWNLSIIQSNVLDIMDPNIVQFTPFDTKSIMLYSMPKSWILNWDEVGMELTPNEVFSEQDIKFWSSIYPFQIFESDNPYTLMLKEIFTQKNEVTKLQEDVLVRMGMRMGLNSNLQYSRGKNLEIILKELGLLN